MIQRKTHTFKSLKILRVFCDTINVAFKILIFIPTFLIRGDGFRLSPEGNHRVSGHAMLKMRLTNEAGSIARLVELPNKRFHSPIERPVVEYDFMGTRNPAGHY